MKRLSMMITGVLLLTACGGGQTETMDFGKAKTEKEVSLAKNGGAPSCKVLLEVAYANGANEETNKAMNEVIEQQLFDMQGLTMQEAADSFANQYIREYRETLTSLYEEDKDDEQKRTWYEYHYTISTKTQAGREGVENYLIDMDFYEGGAHGIAQQLVLNFDMLSGRQLMLRDVFVPGYEARLSELLLEKLMDIVGAKDMEELKEKGYLYMMDMFPTENFVLGSDDITFIYNAYEIAPYAMGKTEIKVKYSEVSDIIKK